MVFYFFSSTKANKNLFIYSGWLKRLNQMCNKKMFGFKNQDKDSSAIDLKRELIARKILSNLLDQDNIKYSTLVFPLLTQPTSKYNESSSDHKHIITDIVFIHGLRGTYSSSYALNLLQI